MLLLTLFLGAAIVLFSPLGERLSARGKKWILGFRFFSLLMLLLMMLRPTLVYTESMKLPASLYLLIDSSESMSVRDELGGKSRYETVQQTLQNSEKTLRELQKRFEVHPFRFDENLHTLEMSRGAITFPAEPTGKETAIGFALDEVYQRAAGKRILATVIFSDGTQRSKPTRDMTPRDAAVRFRDANMPLYAIGVGKPGMPENNDIAVRDLIAPEHIFVKNELVLTGQIRVNGYINREIPVKLMFETAPGQMEEVATRQLTASEDGQLLTYRFSYIPETTGLKKLSVEVPPQPKEVVKTNNEMSTFVRVLDGGLNVLYLEGSNRSEQKYLKWSIDSSPDIQMHYHRFPQQEAVAEAKSPAARGRTADEILRQWTAERPSYVQDYFAPGKYTVYILGDLDATAFKTEELKALAEAVNQGSGLIMIGGFHAFALGGYTGTPLAGVLPVTLRASDRQPLGRLPDEMQHWNQPLLMQPRSEQRNNYIMRLAAKTEDSVKAWQSLPPLEGANRIQVKTAAVVLAEGPQRQPLLVQQQSGAGRVLAFAGDTTWRWWMSGHETEHKRFWRQVILWLAKMDESLQGDCWIEMDRTRFSAGETVKFRVRMRNEKGEEVPSPKVEARLRKPDGSDRC